MKRNVLIGSLALLAMIAVAMLLLRFAPDPVVEVTPPTTTLAPLPPPVIAPTPPEIVLPALPEHGDLKLVLDSPGPFRVYPGMTPNVAIKLVNTSRTQSYPVVKPGDGSEVGWCEPYTFLSATLTRPTGESVELKREPYSRCGVFNGDWAKRVVTLKPGESIPVSWADLIPFDFQEEGAVAMRVHYRYAGLAPHKDVTKAEPAADRGGMKSVPSFEVVSDPIQVEVVRPLDLKLTLKQPTVKVGEEFRLPELLGLELTRRGTEPLGPVLGEPCYGGMVHLFAEVVSDGGPSVIDGGSIGDPAWMYLPRLEPKAGEKIDMFSVKNSLSANFNTPWKGRRGAILRIQAWYHPNSGGSAPVFKSNPVEFTINP